MGSLDMRTASIVAIGGAVIANLAIYFLAKSVLDIDPEFLALANPGSTAFLTVIGVGGAAYVYSWVRRRGGDPRPAFVRFALLALLLSFIPDIGLLLSGQPGATATSVPVLMSMHVVAAAIAVAVLTRVPPSSAPVTA
jgi:hypothetical protein